MGLGLAPLMMVLAVLAVELLLLLGLLGVLDPPLLEEEDEEQVKPMAASQPWATAAAAEQWQQGQPRCSSPARSAGTADCPSKRLRAGVAGPRRGRPSAVCRLRWPGVLHMFRRAAHGPPHVSSCSYRNRPGHHPVLAAACRA